jgi:tetratricopeptide (TPR) repeat protein
LGKFDESITAFNKAIQYKPDWPEAYNNLGYAHGSLKHWDEAIRAHQEAVRLKPVYAGAHFNLGYDYVRKGDRAAAAQQYEKLKPMSDELANKLLSLMNPKDVKRR